MSCRRGSRAGIREAEELGEGDGAIPSRKSGSWRGGSLGLERLAAGNHKLATWDGGRRRGEGLALAELGGRRGQGQNPDSQGFGGR